MPDMQANQPGRDNPELTTQLLAAVSAGDTAAAARLLPIIYEELRRVAGNYFRAQRASHTLQPTALVHEAYLKLVRQPGAQWQDRAHFFAVAAIAMRQILVNHAQAKQTAKRGGGAQRVLLEQAEGGAAERNDLDVLALNDALQKLAELDERKHRVVELRFFAGLSVDEVAAVLEVSRTTVENEWRAARAWLAVELGERSPG